MKTLTLDDLGPRICIMGPSNSGKSTLARAISYKTSLPLIHLDQLCHLPDTKWIPREPEEFYRLHEEAVSGERWVIEGNYTKCIYPRLERATGLILLDVPAAIALQRYMRRCYSSKPRIGGGLTNRRENITWEMLKYIVHIAPKTTFFIGSFSSRQPFQSSCCHHLAILTPAIEAGIFQCTFNRLLCFRLVLSFIRAVTRTI